MTRTDDVSRECTEEAHFSLSGDLLTHGPAFPWRCVTRDDDQREVTCCGIWPLAKLCQLSSPTQC